VEGIVVDNAVFSLSIALSVSAIFAIKAENVQKWRRILNVFALQNFRSAGPQKLYPYSHACLSTRHESRLTTTLDYATLNGRVPKWLLLGRRWLTAYWWNRGAIC